MWRKATCLLAAVLLVSSWRLTAQEAGAVLDQATKALGGDVNSLQITGSGSSFTLGQSPKVDTPWPGQTVKSYTALINYAAPAMRQEIVRTQMLTPPPGVTASTVAGEQRQVGVVSGSRAWNVSADNNTTAAPAAVADRLTLLWSTPHGFLRAARASGAIVKTETAAGRKGTRVTFTAHGKNRMSGVINAQNQLEKVETWVDNAVLGDMLVETTYADYKAFGTVTFPTRIVQKTGGHPTLDLTITAVEANPAADLPVPANVESAPPPAIKVEAQKLADGVYYIIGGSHHSVALDFKDHVVVIEGPQSEARSIAVIDEVKKTIPGKPIRYLVNTHYHFDHSGGIRTYAAEGATIVTHELNKKFYERAFAAPRTINPDRLALAKKAARIETVGDRKVMTDGTRTLELLHIQGNPHNDGFLMAYLPKEKLLIEVDAWSPPAPNAPPPATPVTPAPAAVSLYENIQRLKLDVTSVVPLHGRVMTLNDLAAAVGKPRPS
jgi:glyoxylase-like metal-dependent hydrolase (beta-lactamase superfamily II)